MDKNTTSADGSFDLFYRDGWAILTVYPPTGAGRPVYHDDIRNRMKLLGIPHVEPGRVRRVADEAQGVPVPLVEWPEGAWLSSRISVELSEDAMSARITVTPPRKGGSSPTVEQVLDALQSAGVRSGIDTERIRQLLLDRRYGEPFEVARGQEPFHAQSARIEYHFNPNRGKPYLELDFGRIDLRELNFIENRHEGDLLANLVPAVPARNGWTVTGQTVEANTETRDVELLAGENTELSENGESVYAAMDGNVKLVRKRVTIEPVVQVEKVDYETGNIYFDGSVVVEKDIADRFVVKAGGDIQVGGGVGRATLQAGGNVLLKRGINGGSEGRVECGGNLYAKFIESSTVLARGNVFAEEAIMHSRLSAWRHCILNGRRAEIIGSTVVVGGSLWCKKLGSVAEATVHVAVGISPAFLLEFRRTQEELSSREERSSQVHEQLDQIDRALKEGHSGEKLRQAQGQLAEESARLNEELAALRRVYHDMRDRLEASRTSMVVVEDTVHKGTSISFGRAEYHAPDKGTRKTVFSYNGRTIQEGGYNPSDPPEIDFRSEEQDHADPEASAAAEVDAPPQDGLSSAD